MKKNTNNSPKTDFIKSNNAESEVNNDYNFSEVDSDWILENDYADMYENQIEFDNIDIDTEPIEINDDVPTDMYEPIEINDDVPTDMYEPIEINENDSMDIYETENIDVAEQENAYIFTDVDENQIESLDDQGFDVIEASESNFEVLEDGSFFYSVGNNDYQTVSSTLIDYQGEAYEDFQGTCGLCGVANSLRLLGVENISEKDVIDVAASAVPPLCNTTGDCWSNGGTNNRQICEIFNEFGADAVQKPELSLDDIDSAIQSQNAVMMSVKAEYMTGDNPAYVDPYTAQTDHWVTVVGLKKTETGEISSVLIQDTGSWGENSIIEMSSDKFNWMRENFDDFTGIEVRR